MEKKYEVLHYLAKQLNEKNIVWAVGGSMLLHFLGINTNVDDIDLLVDENDKNRLEEMLQPYPYTYVSQDEKYATSHFYSLTINEIDVDIMIEFKVKRKKGLYEFPFNNRLRKRLEDHKDIYISSITEWLQAYEAMGRDNKVKLIKEYLRK